MTIRIIPRLDIKGPNLVKGIHLEGLRVLGKPERFAKYYYESGADELMYCDVVASLYGRNTLTDIIKRTAEEVFIPITVGGGIRTLDDIKTVLRAGADKVSLNTAVINRPALVSEAANRYGSSTIIVSIEAIKIPNGSYEAYTDNARESTGVDAVEWAIRASELGAGEILVTSIDREGTGTGFDVDLIQAISSNVSVPVIASGGAGEITHIHEVLDQCDVGAVTVGSMLHYGAMTLIETVAEEYSSEGNTQYLQSGKIPSIRSVATIEEIKLQLTQAGIECRQVERGDLVGG